MSNYQTSIWFSLTELDICINLLIIILYGLFNLRNIHIKLTDVYFACISYPFLTILIFLCESSSIIPINIIIFDVEFISQHVYDILLSIITIIVLRSFKTFESILLILIAYIAQLIILHSCDILSFYITLEAQNFCFLVLCGLHVNKRSHGFSVEATIKYLLLSSFSSGILLLSISILYLKTGITGLFFNSTIIPEHTHVEIFLVLLALLFKLGCAPVHLWVVYIYQSIQRSLLIYVSTTPKLALFAFWASVWQNNWTDYTLAIFIVYTLILGSFGAYGLASQPTTRALFAYGTISEIGFILLAAETAGFHSLFQHLTVYCLTQFLVWNLSDKRLFSLCAISLAGLPPLAGFFGKAWIFYHAVNIHIVSLLLIALVCSVLSVVYYLRLLRLFYYTPTHQTISNLIYNQTDIRSVAITSNSYHYNSGLVGIYNNNTFECQINNTSAYVIGLIFVPIFFIKPFVL